MKRPAFLFYPGDWLKDPKLSSCAPATRGIWIDLLCAMFEDGQSGKLQGTFVQLARMCRCESEEIKNALRELLVTKTADVTHLNGNVTVTCRRMFRETQARKNGRQRVQRYREKKECNAKITPPSSFTSSSSVSEEEKKVLKKEVKKRVRGARLSTDFSISLEMRSWFFATTPALDLDRQTQKFINHYKAKTGRGSTSMDWVATWENWMLQAEDWRKEKLPTNGNGTHSASTPTARDLIASLEGVAH